MESGGRCSPRARAVPAQDADGTLGRSGDRVSITERVQSDVAAAAKARDQQQLAALRLVLDELKKAAKDARLNNVRGYWKYGVHLWSR